MLQRLVNPRRGVPADESSLLSARTAAGHTSRFSGPLSVKSVVCGSATWETADGRYVPAGGQVLVIPAGQEYEVRTPPLQLVETFCLFFAPGLVERAVRDLSTGSGALLDDDPPVRPIEFSRLHSGEGLPHAVRRAREAFRAGEGVDEAFFASVVALAQAEAATAARIDRIPALRCATRAELARRIARAAAFLQGNLDRRVTVEEAAREACLSLFHFHRVFRALMGETPHAYVRRLRLLRACSLLLAEERPVADVAAACGFESAGSFASLFRRTWGLTPSQFRRNGELAGDSGE